MPPDARSPKTPTLVLARRPPPPARTRIHLMTEFSTHCESFVTALEEGDLSGSRAAFAAMLEHAGSPASTDEDKADTLGLLTEAIMQVDEPLAIELVTLGRPFIDTNAESSGETGALWTELNAVMFSIDPEILGRSAEQILDRFRSLPLDADDELLAHRLGFCAYLLLRFLEEDSGTEAPDVREDILGCREAALANADTAGPYLSAVGLLSIERSFADKPDAIRLASTLIEDAAPFLEDPDVRGNVATATSVLVDLEPTERAADWLEKLRALSAAYPGDEELAESCVELAE